MSTKAVRAFPDLLEGGSSDIGLYTDVVLMEYFGEYSLTAKSFLITGGRSQFLRAVDAAADNADGCHEGSWQFDHRWTGESRPGLGRDHVNRPDPGGYGQSQEPGPSLDVLAGNDVSPTSGQGAPR
jgi:hypothetical protein